MSKVHSEGQFAELDIGLLDELEGNVNEMDLAQFDALVDGLAKNRFIPPLVVVPKGERYVVLDGNHRLRAARLLQYNTVPAYVVRLNEDELLDVIAARMNIVRGEVNKSALFKIWTRLCAKTDRDTAMAVLGITSEKRLRELLPQVIRRVDTTVVADDAVQVALQRVRRAEDMVYIVRAVLGDSGTDEFDYVAFQVRRSQVLLFRCTKEEYGRLRKITDELAQKGLGVVLTICEALEKWKV